MSEQCQPILASAPVDGEAGRALLDDQQADRRACPGPPVRTAVVTKSARTPLVMNVLAPLTTYWSAVAHGGRADAGDVGAAAGLGDRQRADHLPGQRRPDEPVDQVGVAAGRDVRQRDAVR